MHLVKRYDRERVVAACQRALAIGGISYRSVEAILKHGLDKVPVVVEPPVTVVPMQHANVRGAEYYQQRLMEA